MSNTPDVINDAFAVELNAVFASFHAELAVFHDNCAAADAELAVDWLLASDLNYKKATKHPTELGHQIWADYLYQQLQ